MSRSQPRRPDARAARADAGFTLVETLVTVSLVLVVLGFAVGGWAAYGKGREVDGTAKEVQAALRQAQQRAVSEGRSICVQFDAGQDSWTVYRGACNSSSKTKVDSGAAQGGADIVSPKFQSGPSADNDGVTFLARGSAWPGKVKVKRGDSDGRTINVEGLTGRVTID